MKFGIGLANILRFDDPQGLIELARGAESAGFE